MREFCTCGDRVMCSLRLHVEREAGCVAYTPTKQWVTCGEVRKCIGEYADAEKERSAQKE